MTKRPFVKLQKEIVIFLILFSGISVLTFTVINGRAYAEELGFYFFSGGDSGSAPADSLFSIPQKMGTGTNSAAEFVPVPIFTRLVIPKIRTNVPVIIPASDMMKDILASLEKGVGVYPGSSLPGEQGRSIILGHSSRASWYRGDYATVFTLIKELEKGDMFYIIRGGKTYIYEVTSRQSLFPAKANELFAGPSEPSEVDLVTCYPIGSASKRMVIRARLVLTQGE